MKNDPIQDLVDLLSRYGVDLPRWVVVALGIAVAIGMLYTLVANALGPLTGGIRRAGGAWWGWRQRNTRAARRRASFASHLESQLRRLGEKEEWRDESYTELEAEVEVEGRRRGRRATGLRRVRSLSRAVETSEERLIILQGDPGSGKSVALRHVAQRLARKAMDHPRPDSLIPLYINLKEFKPGGGPITDDHLKSFVCHQLNKANSRDIDRFLDDEFDRGMTEGTWLFLFDSFDEIPDVLSATESDSRVQEYADALFSFLHGMKECRGIVASREFRGPRRSSIPVFRLMPLSQERQHDLIRRLFLPPETEGALYDGLGSGTAVNLMTSNPLFLGLLCEHLRDGGAFPSSAHVVFESYVRSRLTRDAGMLRHKFGLEPEQVRAVAEEFAFAMVSTDGLGLTPARDDLLKTLVASGRTPPEAATGLAALEYIKLARAPEETGQWHELPFTFSHRRFQEYFATCVVLREPGLVPADLLLLDGRWRETAVTILQTQQGPHVDQLLARAHELLEQRFAGSDDTTPWPPKTLHLLGLLAAGTTQRLPAALREATAAFLRRRWDEGMLHDQVWVTESSGVATDDEACVILDRAFQSRSALLHEEAYRRAGQLSSLPDSLRIAMRRCLIGLSVGGRLRRNKPAVVAMVHRLGDPKPFMQAIRLLTAMPWIDAVLLTGFTIALITTLRPPAPAVAVLVPLALLAHFGAYAVRGHPRLALAASPTPFHRGVASLFRDLGSPRAVLETLAALGAGRAFISIIMVFISINNSPSPEQIVVPVCAGLLVAGWAPASVFCIARGLPVGGASWPLIPWFAARTLLVDVRPRRLLAPALLAIPVGLAAFVVAAVASALLLRMLPAFTFTVGAREILLLTLSLFGVAFVDFGRSEKRRRADRRLVAGLSGPSLTFERCADALLRLVTTEGLHKLISLVQRAEGRADPRILILLGDCAAADFGADESPRGRIPESTQWLGRAHADKGAAKAVKSMDHEAKDAVARLMLSRAEHA